MSAITIIPIPAFDDNYIWCIQNNSDCFVVDPGDASPVLDHCQHQGLTLKGILITHHHWDHTNGIPALLEHFPGIAVFGPASGNTKEITRPLSEGDKIALSALELELSVLEVPGHTLDHIAYVCDHGVFCGDTLFSGGCGRLFEGTPAQMHQSLGKLSALPDNLPVYCTHEYTLANLKFAKAVEDENADLLTYTDWALRQRENLQPTLPSSIGREKAINPFLRVANEKVIKQAEQRAGKALTQAEDVFAVIRSWKDHF